jgi:hypothetical protein
MIEDTTRRPEGRGEIVAIQIGSGPTVGAAAQNTNMSLPSSPTRVFVPRVTSVWAPLLPVSVNPEPIM